MDDLSTLHQLNLVFEKLLGAHLLLLPTKHHVFSFAFRDEEVFSFQLDVRVSPDEDETSFSYAFIIHSREIDFNGFIFSVNLEVTSDIRMFLTWFFGELKKKIPFYHEFIHRLTSRARENFQTSESRSMKSMQELASELRLPLPFIIHEKLHPLNEKALRHMILGAKGGGDPRFPLEIYGESPVMFELFYKNILASEVWNVSMELWDEMVHSLEKRVEVENIDFGDVFFDSYAPLLLLKNAKLFGKIAFPPDVFTPHNINYKHKTMDNGSFPLMFGVEDLKPIRKYHETYGTSPTYMKMIRILHSQPHLYYRSGASGAIMVGFQTKKKKLDTSKVRLVVFIGLDEGLGWGGAEYLELFREFSYGITDLDLHEIRRYKAVFDFLFGFHPLHPTLMTRNHSFFSLYNAHKGMKLDSLKVLLKEDLYELKKALEERLIEAVKREAYAWIPYIYWFVESLKVDIPPIMSIRHTLIGADDPDSDLSAHSTLVFRTYTKSIRDLVPTDLFEGVGLADESEIPREVIKHQAGLVFVAIYDKEKKKGRFFKTNASSFNLFEREFIEQKIGNVKKVHEIVSRMPDSDPETRDISHEIIDIDDFTSGYEINLSENGFFGLTDHLFDEEYEIFIQLNNFMQLNASLFPKKMMQGLKDEFLTNAFEGDVKLFLQKLIPKKERIGALFPPKVAGMILKESIEDSFLYGMEYLWDKHLSEAEKKEIMEIFFSDSKDNAIPNQE